MKPRDVYVAATVGGELGLIDNNRDGGIKRAIQNLDIPIVVCAAYRLNSAAAFSLGSGGHQDDSESLERLVSAEAGAETRDNAKMRDLAGRVATIVDALSGCLGDDLRADDSALKSVQGEVDGLVVALEVARQSNARFVPLKIDVSTAYVSTTALFTLEVCDK